MDRELQAMLDRGEENECLEYSEVDVLVDSLGLGEDEIEVLYEEIERRGIELRDDCGREGQGHVRERRPRNGDDRRAPALHERGRPVPAPDEGAGGRARQAHRARRPRGQGADDQLEPAAGHLDREALPGPRALAPRPRPGGDHRAHPRRREVRLAQGLQVLDVRDVVDPPGCPARRRQQVARDPSPRAHRRARAAHVARRARPRAQARPHADRRGGRPGGADHGRRRSRRCAPPRAPSRASTSRSPRRAGRRSRSSSPARRTRSTRR